MIKKKKKEEKEEKKEKDKKERRTMRKRKGKCSTFVKVGGPWVGVK